MLTIMPEKKKELLQAALSECGAEEQNVAVLSARCADELLGYIVIKIENKQVKILALTLAGCDDFSNLEQMDRPLADAMIKAAASYGMNRDCFIAECDNEELFPVLQAFGFEHIDNKMTIDFARLLGKCKNC